MRKPLLDPAILLSPVEDGYVAYDPRSDQLHRLNPSAALIVELSDGRRSVEEIYQIAAPLLPSNVEAEVNRWVDEAANCGVLTFDAPEDHHAAGREMSAEDLTDLAQRLRDAGKIQTAFICQRRAVELTPGDTAMLADLGELAHILGRRDDARDAYQRYLELEPNDAEVRHLLVSLRDEAPPPRVPDECIEQLYHRFSSFYETNMCDELDYQAPNALLATIEESIGGRSDLSVVDLGCGTGLFGQKIKSRASRLVGVDLSPEMVEIAKQEKIYDRLEVAEVTNWLSDEGDRFDLIVACDTLIYFGDLRQVVEPAARLLKPNGLIAFTVERTERPPYQLTDSGRYQHHRDHIEAVASAAGLECDCRESFLRMEYGAEVTGLIAVLSAS